MLFGDSLMAGYGLDEKHHLNIQLYHDLLHHDIKTTIINASVSGDTSFNGLKRISWSLQDDPDYILLGLGANDMLRGIDPNTTLQNLEKIIQIIQEKKDIQTILLGMQSQEAYGEKF